MNRKNVKVENGTEICVAVTEEEIMLYGNREAFLSLSRYMTYLAESDPSEHYECHIFWHLTRYEGKKCDSLTNNVWALFDNTTYRAFSQPDDGFEITFMVVEQNDLENLKKYRDSKLLPQNWNKDSE